MLQHGSYTLLLDSCYDRERFPTLEEAIDWVWANTDEEIAAVKFVLNKFFEKEDERYIQKRVAQELDKYKQNSAVNQKIAQAREDKRRTNRARTVNEPPPNQEPRTKNHKPITKEPKKKQTTLPDKSDDCQAVFDFWCMTMNKNGATKFTQERKCKIQTRLKEGYSVQDIKQAIINCSLSAFHMGQNDNRTVHNDLTLICRTGSKLESFMNTVEAARIGEVNQFSPVTQNNIETGRKWLDG